MSCSDTYKSWIPANSGRLSVDRISKVPSRTVDGNLIYEEKSTYRFSDSFSWEQERSISYKVTLKSIDADFPIDFTMELSSCRIGSTFEKRLLSAEGTIEKNGQIVFTITYDEENIDPSSDRDNIPNTVYTILKNIVHSDNHHDVAVDNVIPVLPVQNYSCDAVLEGILDRIKQMEYQAKHEMREFPTRPNRVLEASLRAKGFQSYYLAFLHHHCSSDRSSIDDKRAQDVVNILKSFASLADLAKLKLERRKHILGVLLTLFAIFVSVNIFIKDTTVSIAKQLSESGISLLHFNSALLLFLFFIFIAVDLVTSRYIPSFTIWLKNLFWHSKKRLLDRWEAQLILFYSRFPKTGEALLVMATLIMLAGLYFAVIGLFLSPS